MKKLLKRILSVVMIMVILIPLVSNLGISVSADIFEISDDIAEYNGNYYKLYENGLTWHNAKTACENMGGHLVTITSEEEQAVIEKLLNKGTKYQYWLGLTINPSPQWITGEDFVYSNWDYGEPNNNTRADGQREDYVHIYNSANPVIRYSERYKWNDMYYDNTFPNEESFFDITHVGFICEWECTEVSEFTSVSPVLSTDEQQIVDELKIDTDALLSNISFGNHPIKGPSVKILGKRFYLFELEATVELPFDGLSIQMKVDTSNKTVEFLLGYETFEADATIDKGDGKDTYWRASYKELKSFYRKVTGKKVTTTKLWNDFSSIRSKLKKIDAGLLVDAECQVAGFLQLSYETGTLKFSEGGILAEAKIGAELSKPIPAFPAIYAVLGLEASVGGKIYVAYENYISLNSEINAGIAANVGVGIGTNIKKIKTSIEGGLKGELNCKLLFSTGMFAENAGDYDPLTVEVLGKVYLKAYLAGFKLDEWSWQLGSIQLYPKHNADLRTAAYVSSFTSNQYLAGATPIERDYLNNNNRLFANATATADDKIYSDTAVYDYNAPVLTALSDGRLLMLWVDDLGTKNDVNKTSLMYSIYDGTGWSTPLEIYEVGTYNGEPVIYNDGTNVHIVWNRAKSVLSDNAELEELVVANEIYYTCFDGNTFSTPVAITDNSIFEINYSVASSENRVAVAWIENSDNDPISSNGTNIVYTKECIDGVWGEKVLVASYEQTISEIVTYYNGDTLCCAYTVVDEENNSDIYSNGTMLCDGEYMNYEDGYIYYLSGSSIYKCDTVTGEIMEIGINNVSNFSVSDGNLYTLVSTGFTCEMYESICTDGVYSDWKQVTEYDRYIRNYSVTADSIGEPVYALNLVSVDEDTEEIYGSSELAVCKAAVIESVKATAVYYDYADVEPSANLELNVDVTNTGNVDFDTATVQILDADGNILSSETVDAQLVAGESTTLKTVYTLPAELSKQDIYAQVVVSDNERDISDNTVSTTVGYGDIAINDLVVEKTENGAVIKGTVSNTGYTDITDVNISVCNSSNPDEILSTISCGDITVGNEYSFEYAIPEEYLSLEDKMTMYGLTFNVECQEEESNYANNSDKVVFGELTDYTVTFVDGNEILNVLSADEFGSYIPEKEGYTFVSWYSSSSLDDDCLITEIPESISENIIVYAKWTEAFVNKFIDIKESHWFYSSVEFVVKHGYMNGMSETKFSPNSNITREQFVLILANIADVDTNEFKEISSGFEDVKTGQWYSGAVTWAVQEGYVSGMSPTKFGRGQSIQRAALARMLYNYASKNGINVEGRADLSSFGDAKEFDKAGNAWMVEPVKWAVDAGIISGMSVNGVNCVNPKGTATRAQAARMLMQFDALMN